MPILDTHDLMQAGLTPSDLAKRQCGFCNRVFTTYAGMRQHVRNSCKIAPNKKNGSKGMEKLYKHTLRQLEVQEQRMVQRDQQIETQRRELETMKTQMQTILSGRDATPAAQHTKDGDIVNNTVVHNTNIVFNLAGGADLGVLDRRWVQRTLERPSEVGDVLEEAFAVVYCNPETPENHVYYIVNSKDLSRVLERRAEGWYLVPARVALGQAHRRLLGRLLDNQPTDVEKANITSPKVAELIRLENSIPAAKMISRYAKGLATHPHGVMTKVAVRAAAGAKAGVGGAS